jgi:hypothetical protein
VLIQPDGKIVAWVTPTLAAMTICRRALQRGRLARHRLCRRRQGSTGFGDDEECNDLALQEDKLRRRRYDQDLYGLSDEFDLKSPASTPTACWTAASTATETTG